MFSGIKLYFTDRPYYTQWRRYTARQKAVRKKLKKQAKEFCPWSGYYMHEMVKTMLEFYHKTYLAGDCCWSEEGRVEEIATTLGVALHWAEALERIDTLEDDELINIAQKDVAFKEYIAAWETKAEASVAEASQPDVLLASLAAEYLTEKYTKAMYQVIGEHLWEWCD